MDNLDNRHAGLSEAAHSVFDGGENEGGVSLAGILLDENGTE